MVMTKNRLHDPQKYTHPVQPSVMVYALSGKQKQSLNKSLLQNILLRKRREREEEGQEVR
jgi:hypothetical protein